MASSIGQSADRRQQTVFMAWMAMATTAMVGCLGAPLPPDQSPFAPLDSLGEDGRAVVRLYAAPLPVIEAFAIHAWFVIKPAGSAEFHRWEVWVEAGGPYAYVREDLFPPEGDFGAGKAYVLAELAGTEAERVTAFIETQCPTYPCRERFDIFWGPNSSTFVQWVLDGAEWNVTLPPSAIGKDLPADCP